MEMERFNGRARAEDRGVVALAKASKRVSLLVVWAWTTHFRFTKKILRVLCVGTLSISDLCNLKDLRQSRSQPSWSFCQGPSGVVCFCVFLLQDALWFPEERAESIQQRRKSDLGWLRGNAWSRVENKSQEFGSERKSEKKKGKVRF